MAQACTPTVITMAGCSHCENLKSMLNNAGIKYTETTSGSCACYPCAVLCNGSSVSSCGGNAEVDVFNAIKASIATATPSPTTKPATTPVAKPTTTAAAPPPTPEWKTTVWSNEISINWGKKNPRPAIKETPIDWQHPDVQLTPILPLPPTMTTGITFALRDHKKVPRGRKVA